jgi:adenylate cyclase
LARLFRDWRERRRGIFQVTYPEGRRVRVTTGATLLEVSRGAGIPHASVCGGRGRCSTCRVRVGAGASQLPPPSEAEARVLARIGAAPNTRLACQTRPLADVEITPLLSATAGPRQAMKEVRQQQGEEREVAVLFADLRGFTALAENRLPYDVVFVLNRYFAAMGTAVEESGGRVDKFIGDGVMALFGVDRDVETGCRDALAAARRMIEHLGELNKALENDLDRPLRIGIGIHSGPVILGEMGYGRATAMTAIGDSVNTASRLEALTKEFEAELVLSEPVATRAGLDFSTFPRHEIELRGRAGQLAVFVVGDTRSLP